MTILDLAHHLVQRTGRLARRAAVVLARIDCALDDLRNEPDWRVQPRGEWRCDWCLAPLERDHVCPSCHVPGPARR